MPRIDVQFYVYSTSENSTSDSDIIFKFYQFNGSEWVWDEYAWTVSEAYRQYPPTLYRWILAD